MALFSSRLFLPNLRRIPGAAAAQRPIMTSSSRAEKAVEQLKTNSYYEKYADKIAKLQKTSPEEFLSRIDNLERDKNPAAKKPPPNKAQESHKFSQLLHPKKPLDHVEKSDEQSLDSVMKLELLGDKSAEEIEALWREYHKDKNFITAAIPAGDWQELRENFQRHPTFLFPLPRSQGYEFIMAQFQGNSVHFTPLLYYQVHKENAPECLTMKHYTELVDSKGIVLMRGEYDSKIIDLKEAQCLGNELQLYYLKPSEDRSKLLETFTQRPDQFKHMDLVKQIESLSL